MPPKRAAAEKQQKLLRQSGLVRKNLRIPPSPSLSQSPNVPSGRAHSPIIPLPTKKKPTARLGKVASNQPRRRTRTAMVNEVSITENSLKSNISKKAAAKKLKEVEEGVKGGEELGEEDGDQTQKEIDYFDGEALDVAEDEDEEDGEDGEYGKDDEDDEDQEEGESEVQPHKKRVGNFRDDLTELLNDETDSFNTKGKRPIQEPFSDSEESEEVDPATASKPATKRIKTMVQGRERSKERSALGKPVRKNSNRFHFSNTSTSLSSTFQNAFNGSRTTFSHQRQLSAPLPSDIELEKIKPTISKKDAGSRNRASAKNFTPGQNANAAAATDDNCRVYLLTKEAFPGGEDSENFIVETFEIRSNREITASEIAYFVGKLPKYRGHYDDKIYPLVVEKFGYGSVQTLVTQFGLQEVQTRIQWDIENFAWQNANWEHRQALKKKGAFLNPRFTDIIAQVFLRSPHVQKIKKLEEVYSQEIPPATVGLAGAAIVHSLKTIEYYARNQNGKNPPCSPPSFTGKLYSKFYNTYKRNYETLSADKRRAIWEACGGETLVADNDDSSIVGFVEEEE